jgi:hypothetical protein
VGPEALWTSSIFMIAFAIGSLALARHAFRKEIA